jgi:hypothetical protein
VTPILRQAFHEAARPRTLIAAAVAEAAFVLVGKALPAADAAASARLAERSGLVGAMLLLGGLAAASGAGLVAEEVRTGRAAAILARPLSRGRWVLARLAGLSLALASAALVLGVVHAAAVAASVGGPDVAAALTSRRALEPASIDASSGGHPGATARFASGPSAAGAATLRGRLDLESPEVLAEQQLTVHAVLSGPGGEQASDLCVRPGVPFAIEAPSALASASFEVVSPHVTSGVRLREVALLLEPTSRALRVAKSFVLVLLASLAVAGFATAASAVLSAPVALALALLLAAVGFAPDALPDSARLLAMRREPRVVVEDGRRLREWAPSRFERAVLLASRPLPDLLSLWPADFLDAGFDPPWSSLPSRALGSWPQAAAALALALVLFGRRDL